MNRTSLVLLITMLLATSAAAFFWWQLHVLQGQPGSFQAEPTDWHAASPSVRAYAPEAGPTRKQPPIESKGVSAADASNAQVARPASQQTSDEPGAILPAAVRALALKRLNSVQRHRYPGLAAAVGLSAQEADQLRALLSEQELRNFEHPPFVPEGDERWEPGAEPDWLRKQQEQSRRNEGEVKASLGDERYQRWLDYAESLGSRAQVRELRMFLDDTSEPLRQEQLQPLIAAFTDAGRRRAQEYTAKSKTRSLGPRDDEERVAMMQRGITSLEQDYRALREAAAPHLSPGQLRTFAEALESRLEDQRVGLQLERAHMAAAAQGDAAVWERTALDSVMSLATSGQ